MINTFICNSLPQLDNLYALIIGYRPSNGARSPSIWNHYFNSSSASCHMYPADVDSEDDLESLLTFAASDPLFLGAAVAAPYKSSVYTSKSVHVSDLSSLSSHSVNCIYRSSGGSLKGINTDALAFVLSLKKFRLDTLKPVFIYGLGSTGRAISSLLSKFYQVSAFNRTSHPQLISFSKQNNIRLLPSLPTSLSSYQLVVNATIVGSSQFEAQNQLLFTQDLVSTSSPRLLYYDINYTPESTEQSKVFESLNIATVNGLAMNQLQAYIALSHVMHRPLDQITCHFM